MFTTGSGGDAFVALGIGVRQDSKRGHTGGCSSDWRMRDTFFYGARQIQYTVPPSITSGWSTPRLTPSCSSSRSNSIPTPTAPSRSQRCTETDCVGSRGPDTAFAPWSRWSHPSRTMCNSNRPWCSTRWMSGSNTYPGDRVGTGCQRRGPSNFLAHTLDRPCCLQAALRGLCPRGTMSCLKRRRWPVVRRALPWHPRPPSHVRPPALRGCAYK